MKVGTFAKVCALGASAAIITAGFIAAPAAMADPSGTPALGATTLAGYGSDTTQDVMNALATAINADHSSETAWVASWDALGATTISNPKGSTLGGVVPRANGSGEGDDVGEGDELDDGSVVGDGEGLADLGGHGFLQPAMRHAQV